PFWSADSHSVGFFAGGKLKRIDADGGRLQTLADAPVPQGGTWNRDGVILFSRDYDAIYKIPATGGPSVLLRKEETSRQETSNNAPTFLPDGKRFLFWVGSPRSDVAGIYVASLDDPNTKLRVPNVDSWA